MNNCLIELALFFVYSRGYILTMEMNHSESEKQIIIFSLSEKIRLTFRKINFPLT